MWGVRIKDGGHGVSRYKGISMTTVEDVALSAVIWEGSFCRLTLGVECCKNKDSGVGMETILRNNVASLAAQSAIMKKLLASEVQNKKKRKPKDIGIRQKKVRKVVEEEEEEEEEEVEEEEEEDDEEDGGDEEEVAVEHEESSYAKAPSAAKGSSTSRPKPATATRTPSRQAQPVVVVAEASTSTIYRPWDPPAQDHRAPGVEVETGDGVSPWRAPPLPRTATQGSWTVQPDTWTAQQDAVLTGGSWDQCEYPVTNISSIYCEFYPKQNG